MRILAIDTAMESCSVALLNNSNCFSYFKECHREHAQHILPLVKEILLQGDTTLTELDGLAFSHGPGNFTGIRIGISIAQGLALGAKLPMIGVSTLATMAQGAFRQTGAIRVLVAIDARMGEIYWGEYTRDNQGVWHCKAIEVICKPEVITARLNNLSGEWAIVGTGWKVWPKMTENNALTLVDGKILLSVAEDMLPIARQMLATGKTVSVEYARPVYLRNTAVWKKLPGKK